MGIESGFTVLRSNDKTEINVIPADEYVDSNLQITGMFNLAGVGCIGVAAIFGGLIAAMAVAVPLSEIALFDNNDTMAMIVLGAVFFSGRLFLVQVSAPMGPTKRRPSL